MWVNPIFRAVLLSELSFFEIKVYGTDNVKIYFKHLLKIMSNDYLWAMSVSVLETPACEECDMFINVFIKPLLV